MACKGLLLQTGEAEFHASIEVPSCSPWWNVILIHLIDRISNAEDWVELHEVLAVAVGPFDFDYVVGGYIGGGNAPIDVFLQHRPVAWGVVRGTIGDVATDPIIATAIASACSFVSNGIGAPQSAKDQRHPLVGDTFSWKHIVAVPVHGPGDERGIMIFASLRCAANDFDRSGLEALAISAYRRGRALGSETRPRLAARERDALAQVALGLDDLEIASALGVSKSTAHTYVERAKTRLSARSRAQAVARALKLGLI